MRNPGLAGRFHLQTMADEEFNPPRGALPKPPQFIPEDRSWDKVIKRGRVMTSKESRRTAEERLPRDAKITMGLPKDPHLDSGRCHWSGTSPPFLLCLTIRLGSRRQKLRFTKSTTVCTTCPTSARSVNTPRHMIRRFQRKLSAQVLFAATSHSTG